jgi:hypothetical protein
LLLSGREIVSKSAAKASAAGPKHASVMGMPPWLPVARSQAAERSGNAYLPIDSSSALAPSMTGNSRITLAIGRLLQQKRRRGTEHPTAAIALRINGIWNIETASPAGWSIPTTTRQERKIYDGK